MGCELRTPIFCKQIIKFALKLDPKLLDPSYWNGVEKFLLRKAFEGYLPHDILWRTKNAFSDATSLLVEGKSSWKEVLKDHAELVITDQRFAAKNELYSYQTPQTKEDFLYREIFAEFGYDATTIPYKWMPSWAPADLVDSSATEI